VLAPVVRQHGLATSEVIARWPELVGERFADVTRPLRVLWPRLASEVAVDRPREPATLVVRCVGAHALDLQHAAPAILERINTLYGFAAIGRLTIRQGPVEPRARKSRRPEAPPAPRHLTAGLGAIRDDALRDALDRLGRAVAEDGRKV
jgi:hypothetical protein